jgi:hypothetical protein
MHQTIAEEREEPGLPRQKNLIACGWLAGVRLPVASVVGKGGQIFHSLISLTLPADL